MSVTSPYDSRSTNRQTPRGAQANPGGHTDGPPTRPATPTQQPGPEEGRQAAHKTKTHTPNESAGRGDDQKLRESNPRPSAPSGGGQTDAKRGGSEGQRGRANNGPATTQAAAQPRAPASEGISSAKGIPDARKSTTSHTGLGQQPRRTAPHPQHGSPNHEKRTTRP